MRWDSIRHSKYTGLIEETLLPGCRDENRLIGIMQSDNPLNAGKPAAKKFVISITGPEGGRAAGSYAVEREADERQDFTLDVAYPAEIAVEGKRLHIDFRCDLEKPFYVNVHGNGQRLATRRPNPTDGSLKLVLW